MNQLIHGNIWYIHFTGFNENVSNDFDRNDELEFFRSKNQTPN